MVPTTIDNKVTRTYIWREIQDVTANKELKIRARKNIRDNKVPRIL